MRRPFDELPPQPAPLSKVPFPARGEHLGSYVRRLAVANGATTLAELASWLRLPPEHITSAEGSWPAILRAADLPKERLAALELDDRGYDRRHLVRINGSDIGASQFDFMHLRSCSGCIREEGFLSKRFGIRSITACVRHRLRLTDGCACGAPRLVNGSGAPWACSRCGLPYSDLPQEPADARELLISSLLEATPGAETSTLPTGLNTETLSARAAVVERLGVSVVLERIEAETGHPGDPRNVWIMQQGRRLSDDREIALAAATCLADWPAPYLEVLERLVDRHVSKAQATTLARRFASPAGRYAIRPFVDHRGREIAFAEEARNGYIRTTLGYVPHQRTVLSESSFYANLENTPSASTDGPLEVKTFVPAIEFASRMHVGADRHLAASFEAGLIGTVQHVDGHVLVRRTDFDALLERVKAIGEGGGCDDDYVPSLTASGKRGPFYRQREFYQDVFSGRIRSRDAGPQTEGMASRLIHIADFERRRLLCKTAIQLVDNQFTRRPSFVPQLWGREMPRRDLLRALGQAGGIDWRDSQHDAPNFSMRGIVDLVQRESGQILFRTDPTVLDRMSSADWRSVLVQDDSGLRLDATTPSTVKRDMKRSEAERRADILERFITLDRRDEATNARFAAELGLSVNSLLIMSADWRRHRNVALLQGDLPKITPEDRANALEALRGDVDMAGVAPTRLAETSRRLAILRAFLEIGSPTMDDRRDAATQMGVNPANFMKTVRRWTLHRSALVIPGATHVKRKRHNKR